MNLEGAELRAAGGTALQAESLTVGTDLNALRLCAHGRVVLSGARIPRHLNLAHARLSRPDGEALSADSCVVGELWLRDTAPITGTVDLRRSQVEFLHALPDVWPERVRIDGLSYRTLAPHLPRGTAPSAAGARDRGLSAAQLRTVDQRLPCRRRRRGRPHGAADETPPPPRHADLVRPLVRAPPGRSRRLRLPSRQGGRMAAVAPADRYHRLHALRTTPPEARRSPDFHPLVYTLDLLLPFVGFGQENAFTPRGAWQWLAYLLIVTGWILATTVLAGITRALSRQ